MAGIDSGFPRILHGHHFTGQWGMNYSYSTGSAVTAEIREQGRKEQEHEFEGSSSIFRPDGASEGKTGGRVRNGTAGD